MAGSIEFLLPRRTRTLQRHGKAKLRAGLIALLALALSSSAMAQPDQQKVDVDSPGLVIEAIAGWDGTVDQSTPIPVSFLISNYSDRIIEGHFTLSGSLNGHGVALGEVVISPGATRRFSSIQALTDWHQCFATLSDGKKVLWRRELALNTGNQFLANLNYVLFIDKGERKLQLPGALSDTATVATTDFTVAGKQGRPIRCLAVKPWQVPNHPGPLVVAQAMVFPAGAAVADLNRAQWRAVAKWICQGGTLFVHDKSREIIGRLTDSAPLRGDTPVQSGEFVVRHIGLGAIYEYPRQLFSSEGGKTRQRIAETTADLTKHHISTLVDLQNLYRSGGGRADMNRILVVAFFGFYTLFSGIVALLLFRRSQRMIATYTLTVVIATSVLSGLLGGFLRFSQGDLRWITVTQAGAGGVVQVGKLDVQSAGARNTRVAVKGEHADLQYIRRSRHHYYWNRQQIDYSPFTWQPNLAKDEDDIYQINVPMTPWGRRHLQATAFKPELRRLDFELGFEPRDSPINNAGEQTQSPGMPLGIFSLKLVNHLPFKITNCSLIIGVTHKTATQTVPGQADTYVVALQSGQTVTSTVDGLIDVYHTQELSALTAGGTYEDAFQANFRAIQNKWDLYRSWEDGQMIPPRISHLGAASAWLIGRVEKSPILEIDEQRSDFVPQKQLHLFIQEILPEDMPDASLFLGASEDAAIEGEEPVTP